MGKHLPGFLLAVVFSEPLIGGHGAFDALFFQPFRGEFQILAWCREALVRQGPFSSGIFESFDLVANEQVLGVLALILQVAQQYPAARVARFSGTQIEHALELGDGRLFLFGLSDFAA